MGRNRNPRLTKESTPSRGSKHPTPKRIFISYAHAGPAQALARALDGGLRKAGHDVFIDTEIKFGADWGATILNSIAASDFFVVLLSSHSVHSEFVREEVRLAREGRSAHGRPALLPVRVQYPGPLGLPLGAWLNPYQSTSWDTDDDTERLLRQILDVIDGGLEPPPVGPPSPSGPAPSYDFHRPEPTADLSQFTRPGGGLRPDDPFWIERKADREVLDIAQHLLEETVVIQGPRQVGKSSLLARYLADCRRAGKKTALIDLSLFETNDLSAYPKFLTLLATELLDRLELNDTAAISGSAQLTRFVRDKILRQVPDNLVLGLDELDRVLGQPYQSDFFAMLRHWHERRSDATQPDWARLELALVISTEPYLLIRDAERSPFNVRVPNTLPPFNAVECRELNRRYGHVLTDEQAERLRQELLGGHPFLTRLAYYRMTRPNPPSFDELMQDAARLDGPFGDHLRALQVKLRANTSQDLLAALQQVIRHGTVPNDDAMARLLGAGLIRSEGDRFIPANRLYARFFGNLG
jgi:hypothetical protein